MQVTFATRSRFLEVIESAIQQRLNPLLAGDRVMVSLESGGYPGRITVSIKDTGGMTFEADWTGNDPTRFPARIKAAATALKASRCFGRFVIDHDDGVLSIQRIGDAR